MEDQNQNVMRRSDAPEPQQGVTESTTPPEGEKTPIEAKLDKLTQEGKIPEAGKEQESREEPKEKELTEEQKKALEKHEAEKAEKQKEQLAKKQKAYEMLQQGAYFIKFIYDDIERQKKEQLNRPQRRRFEKELRKGIFSKELVEVYLGKIDVALDWIEKNINNASQTLGKIQTHYKTQGLENPEFLKSILEDYFKSEFKLKGDPEDKPVDGAEYYEKLKADEAEGKLKDESRDTK